MSGVAKKDFVGMYADPFRTQPPRDVASYGRGKHSDNNQIKTGANFECGGRYARIAPGGYYREAHAYTERKEDKGQSCSSNGTRCNRGPRYRWAFRDRGRNFNRFKNHQCPLG